MPWPVSGRDRYRLHLKTRMMLTTSFTMLHYFANPAANRYVIMYTLILISREQRRKRPTSWDVGGAKQEKSLKNLNWIPMHKHFSHQPLLTLPILLMRDSHDVMVITGNIGQLSTSFLLRISSTPPVLQRLMHYSYWFLICSSSVLMCVASLKHGLLVIWLMTIPLLVVTLCSDVIARSERVGESVFTFARVTDLVPSFPAINSKSFG